MFEFAWPLMLLFLPLPLLVWIVLPSDEANKDAALRVPNIEEFKSKLGVSSYFSVTIRKLIFSILLWVLLVIAGARPQWIEESQSLATNSRNLMLAVDMSGSMDNKDFFSGNYRLSRLDAAKAVVGDFIKRRKGDRIGLIVFGTHAYQYVPLTFDTITLKAMLDETFIAIAGNDTSVGDAIGLGIKNLKNKKSAAKVLILMTDGEHNTGSLTPVKAAKIAAKVGLKIYTIGIGPAAYGQMRSGFNFGMRRFRGGFDEVSLRKVAKITGGQYFHAANTDKLIKIYKYLDELEPVDEQEDRFRPKTEYYFWFLSLFLILVFMSLSIKFVRQRLD